MQIKCFSVVLHGRIKCQTIFIPKLRCTMLCGHRCATGLELHGKTSLSLQDRILLSPYLLVQVQFLFSVSCDKEIQHPLQKGHEEVQR